MEATEFRSALAGFTGTERHYRHWSGLLIYTDGVRFLGTDAGAYWLIDAIALAQVRARKDGSLREFQLWELIVRSEGRADLVCSRDSEDEAFRFEVVSCDFPTDYIKLYVEGGVALLPTEH